MKYSHISLFFKKRMLLPLFGLVVASQDLSAIASVEDIDAYTPTTGKTPLMEAVRDSNCSAHVIRTLITLKADIDKKDGLGNEMTALMIASKSGCVVGAKILMEERADWRAKNILGVDALGMALNNQRYKVASAILSSLAGEKVVVDGNAQVEVVRSAYSAAEKRESDEQDAKNIEDSKPKIISVQLKMGFSLGDTSGTAVSSLNSKLEGKYRLSKSVKGEGKFDVFYSKQDDLEAQYRYLLQNRITREDLFGSDWDGTIDAQLQSTNAESEVKTVALIEKSWEFLEKRLKFRMGAGPGVRWVDFDDGSKESGTDITLSVREKVKWTPRDIFGWKTSSILTQDYEGDFGENGDSHKLSFEIDYPLAKDMTVGVSAIFWRKTNPEGDALNDHLLQGHIKKAW